MFFPLQGPVTVRCIYYIYEMIVGNNSGYNLNTYPIYEIGYRIIGGCTWNLECRWIQSESEHDLNLYQI